MSSPGSTRESHPAPAISSARSSKRISGPASGAGGSRRGSRRKPNGYLHIGHAKSICLNFGLARDFDGVCHLRFDDTNPVKEDQEYVDSIMDAVHWLGVPLGHRS
jgi:hypothetical protein